MAGRSVWIVFSMHPYGADLAGFMGAFATEDAARAFVNRVESMEIVHPAHEPERGFGFTFEIHEHPVYRSAKTAYDDFEADSDGPLGVYNRLQWEWGTP